MSSDSNQPPPSSSPSLAIKSVTIENYRVFRERTEILLNGDPIVTFHGGNGSGKSTALEAIAIVFTATLAQLGQNPAYGEGVGEFEWLERSQPGEGPRISEALLVRYSDRVPGILDPTILRVDFIDPRCGALVAIIEDHGNKGRLYVEWVRDTTTNARGDMAGKDFEPIKRTLVAPHGPASAAFKLIAAHRGRHHRHPSWLRAGHVLDRELARELYNLRTSQLATERKRWRDFVDMTRRFVSLADREVTVETSQRNGNAAELFFERRDHSVLDLARLSSGEQQFVALCATLTLSRAAIVAIEEPELNLHPQNQALLLEVLSERIKSEREPLHQVILESHVPTFDHAHAVHFERTASGDVVVERRAARAPDADAIRQKARAAKADEFYVTQDGYTRLPEPMRKDLSLERGGDLWFIKRKGRWQAWKEDELAAALTVPEEPAE